MKNLEYDLQTLNEDIDIVLALESRNVSSDDPIMLAISERWGLSVATEKNPFESRLSAPKEIAKLGVRGTKKAVAKTTGATLRGAGKVAKFAGNKAADAGKYVGSKAKEGGAKLSSKLLNLMSEFASETYDKLKEKVAFNLDKSNKLKKELDSLKDVIETGNFKQFTLDPKDWMSKICLEDKVNLDACFNFKKYVDDADKIYKDVTIKLQKFKTDLNLDKPTGFTTLSKSSSWAAKRSAGLFGVTKTGDYNAVCLPGNIIYLVKKGNIREEVVNFGIAHKYEGSGILSLGLVDCKKALAACDELITFIKDRGSRLDVKGVRDVGSYTGIYKSVEDLKEEIGRSKDSDVSRSKIRTLTRQLQNLITIEDAITTAAVRVCEGLISYIKISK